MSSSSWETLPLLVLESICEHLAQCDSKRRSLFAFSLASKRCCGAATRQRFQRILFRVKDEKNLYQSLQQWTSILQVDGRAGHVRQVKVTGRIRKPPTQTEVDELLVATDRLEEELFEPEDNEGDLEEGDFDRPPNFPLELRSSPQGEEKERQTELWVSLAQFIKHLPRLLDLIYDYTSLFPQCLLETLHQRHPDCRLHIHHFSFPSLYQRKDQPHDINPYEYALATSPCLYSIGVLYSAYDSDGNVNYNREAVLHMVSRLTPRLKHVYMLETNPGDSIAYREAALSSPRPPWQGFFVGKPTESSRPIGNLESLCLAVSYPNASSQLMEWGNHTDYSQLYSLEIRYSFDLEAVRTLTRIVEDKKFGSLRALTLSICANNDSEESHIDDAMSQLLKGLHPLQNLRLSGPMADKAFQAVLHSHGDALRELSFMLTQHPKHSVDPHVVSHRQIQELQQWCPNLQEFELRMPRTKGDEREVRTYRALGALSRLKRLSLLLDCSVLEGPDANVFTPLAPHQARDIFINAALDSSLAVSIFRIIFDTNTIASPTNRGSSQHLKLKISAAALSQGGWTRTEIDGITNWIGRSWACERDSTTKHSANISVREIGKQKREKMGEYLEPQMEECLNYGTVYEKIWKEIWPERTGDWREDWWSFPLWDGK